MVGKQLIYSGNYKPEGPRDCDKKQRARMTPEKPEEEGGGDGDVRNGRD